jgi:hypothetical protein
MWVELDESQNATWNKTFTFVTGVMGWHDMWHGSVRLEHSCRLIFQEHIVLLFSCKTVYHLVFIFWLSLPYLFWFWIHVTMDLGHTLDSWHPSLIARFCLSSLLTNGSLFLDVLTHAHRVLCRTLKISFDQRVSQSDILKAGVDLNLNMTYLPFVHESCDTCDTVTPRHRHRHKKHYYWLLLPVIS